MSERSHQSVETDSFSLEGLPSHMGEAGLRLTTKHTLTRHDLAPGDLGLSEKDLATYANALRGEGRFNKVGDYQAVLMANKDAASKGDKKAQDAIADA